MPAPVAALPSSLGGAADWASEAMGAVFKFNICRAVQCAFFLSGFICLLPHIKLASVFPATSG